MSRHYDQVVVHADLERFEAPVIMGTLHRQRGRSDIFSFTYERLWLERPEAFAFDPDLSLVEGPQYPPPARTNFGIFLDSSPDRWGRMLMQRRENARAREHARPPRTLTEWDFLLGVHDETRMGALRFQAPEGGDFIDSDRTFAAPPLTSLRELQAASLQYEAHADEEDHPAYQDWLAQLFAPGTSLGGARPKASIRDEQGRLCIAKFPSREDRRDIGAWELVAHALAGRAGINVPPVRAMRLPDSPHTTFIARRFDRTDTGRRKAFVSAMTLTQRIDGEPGASYLELVDLLQSGGANTGQDCRELFRRVLFNVLVHNTDDHLRNHGFFIDRGGITLSPAYDINPAPDQRELSLAINEVDTTCDVSVVMDACADYGLSRREADLELAAVQAAVAHWREEAQRLGIPRSEIAQMQPAFQT